MIDQKQALREEIDALPDVAVRHVLAYVRLLKSGMQAASPERPPGSEVGLADVCRQSEEDDARQQSAAPADARLLLTLPARERDPILAAAADKVAEFYKPGSALMEWTDAFVDDPVDEE